MANVLTSMIFGGVLERFPRMRLVLGESGIGWIPYILWRMDAEWEDQFKDLSLTMPPSEYWKRQCWATYQTDPIGVKLLDELGADKVMWGSDFPHPDGVWPDSKRVHRARARAPARPTCGARSSARTRRGSTTSRSVGFRVRRRGGGAGGGAADHGPLRPPAWPSGFPNLGGFRRSDA